MALLSCRTSGSSPLHLRLPTNNISLERAIELKGKRGEAAATDSYQLADSCHKTVHNIKIMSPVRVMKGKVMTDMIKVLAIDDEDTVQSILTVFINRYLDTKGVESSVKMLNDPVQGLFELTTQGDQYDAILLDVRLPKLTGDEIYSSLIHVNPELLERVIFVTGYPDDLTDRFPDMDLKILQKPFRYQDFMEKLNTVLKPN